MPSACFRAEIRRAGDCYNRPMQSVSGRIWSRPVAIGAVASVWLAMTALFWVGYAGADDMFYARYAFLFHRPPINWWEFRIPAILAIRAAFLLFGPSAFSAALPSLVASLAILFSVAWLVHWPAQLNWQTTGAMLLAATLIDRKRFLGPVIACLLFSLCLALIEAAVYKHLVGDALARFRMSASESANQAFDSDPDTNLTGLAFFLWPVRNLFFGKAFGCDLILTLIAGLLAWKFLFWRQKLLFLSAFLTWAWI